jgi:hypothetical protein
VSGLLNQLTIWDSLSQEKESNLRIGDMQSFVFKPGGEGIFISVQMK